MGSSTEAPPVPSRARLVARWIGLAGGPLAFAAVLALGPETYTGVDGASQPFSAAGRATLGTMAWMALWWMTEAIDVQATALLPLVVLPLAGASTIGEAASPYASPLIYLFLGGFLLAASMRRWGLDRRLALLTLRLVGPRPSRMVGGIMLATAAMSAFVSNTATAATMLPIGVGLAGLVARPGLEGAARREARDFETCLFLGITYAASIGGLATIIGSPPNGFLVQFSASELGIRIGFLEWMAVGAPLCALFLPLAWLLLTRVLYRVSREEVAGGRELLRAELARLGPASRGEWTTLAVFCAAVLAWVGRPLLERVAPGISDPGIAVAAGLALFVIPVDARRGEFALDWSAARDLPWGVLVLFGGGLSLAEAVGEHGVAELLGAQASAVAGLPPLLVVLVIASGVIFLTELTSNTATAATLVPLFAALAPGLGVDPLRLALPATLAASCAFMLPVATPPNAIVFGSGRVSIGSMCRAGLWLNLSGVALIAAATYWLELVGPGT